MKDINLRVTLLERGTKIPDFICLEIDHGRAVTFAREPLLCGARARSSAG